MTPLQSLARAIQDTGGGWFQAWTTPSGWTLMVYRDGNLHAYATGADPEACIATVLESIGSGSNEPA